MKLEQNQNWQIASETTEKKKYVAKYEHNSKQPNRVT